MKKEAALFFLLLLLSCSSINLPVQFNKEPLDVRQLENGMTVTLKEQHSTPLVTIQFWVHVGSRNENDTYRGIAHIFEHIWFKGTPTQPVGSFHKRVESLGGELNAMTSQDWTMFFVSVPSDKFDDIFPFMADLLLHPAFNETEIEKEKQVVTEEQRFSFNEPEKYLDDQFGLLLIDSHPYRNPIIGYKPTIANATRDAIIDFYHTWYVPNNINVIIVGDINKTPVFSSVKNAFSTLPKKPLPPLNFPMQKPITQPRYNSSTKSVGDTYSAIGYLGPSSHDNDRFALTVLNTIFSNGESSRLQKMKSENLITKANSVFVPLNDFGIFETIIVVEPAKKANATARILLELNSFKNTYVTSEELDRAKNTISAEKLKSQEEIFQNGFDIGSAWIAGNVDDANTYLDHINSVTQEDVQAVAEKYFIAHTLYEVKSK